MQLEACIYRNLSSTDHDSPETVSQHHIPRALRELFKSYKASGYQLIIDAMTEMAKCEENVPSGCTGHRYGLIECEPSGWLTKNSCLLKAHVEHGNSSV